MYNTPSSVVKNMRLPVLQVVADTLPEAWEAATLLTWENGKSIATQYDKEGDPLSRDCTMLITVCNPFSEPRIHKSMPGGIADLESYRQEVVDGIRDHWIDPSVGKWQYSYHQRLTAYDVPNGKIINQLEYIIDALIEQPYTRQAQAVLWQPWEDAGYKFPACLQRIWFRIFDDELVAGFDMRSNDAYKAAFMNMYAFTDLQRYIAEKVSERLSEKTGEEVKIRPGQYNHYVNSFHIYGSYFSQFEGFLKAIEKRTWEQRTYRTEDVQYLIDEARVDIAAALAKEKAEHLAKESA